MYKAIYSELYHDITHPDGIIEVLNTYATKDGEIYMIIRVNGDRSLTNISVL